MQKATKWRTFSATSFFWLCCLLSGTTSIDAQTLYPDLYLATGGAGLIDDVSAPGKDNSYASTCEKWGQQKYPDNFVSCIDRGSYDIQQQIWDGQTLLDTYSYPGYSFDVKYHYYYSDGSSNILSDRILVRGFCSPRTGWNSTKNCLCLAKLGQSTDAGYLDRGSLAVSYTTAPKLYCDGDSATATSTSGSTITTVSTSTTNGCVANARFYGPYSGVMKGIRHSYYGIEYIGSLVGCAPPEKKPILQGNLEIDQARL